MQEHSHQQNVYQEIDRNINTLKHHKMKTLNFTLYIIGLAFTCIFAIMIAELFTQLTGIAF